MDKIKECKDIMEEILWWLDVVVDYIDEVWHKDDKQQIALLSVQNTIRWIKKYVNLMNRLVCTQFEDESISNSEWAKTPKED